MCVPRQFCELTSEHASSHQNNIKDIDRAGRRNTMPRAVYNEPLAGTPPPSHRDDDDSVSIDSAGLAGDWDDDDEDYELEPDPSDDDEEPASTAAAPPVATRNHR